MHDELDIVDTYLDLPDKTFFYIEEEAENTELVSHGKVRWKSPHTLPPAKQRWSLTTQSSLS
jgi:hypothetical protein